MEYPAGIDAGWLGADERGRVGLFITAGQGPVPAAALSQLECDPWPEEAIMKLSKSADCTLSCNVPDPSTFVAVAERGFFVFDWSDIYCTHAEELGEYELVASPSIGVSLQQAHVLLGELGVIPVICRCFEDTVGIQSVRP